METVVGAVIAFFGVVAGLVFNQAVTAKREKAMLESQRTSLLSSVAADFIAMSTSIQNALEYMANFVREDRGIPLESALEMAQVPTPMVIPEIGNRLGILPPDTAARIVEQWHELSVAYRMQKASLIALKNGALRIETANSRYQLSRDIAVGCHDFAESISGAKGMYTRPVRELSAEEAKDLLSAKVGSKADRRLSALCS